MNFLIYLLPFLFLVGITFMTYVSKINFKSYKTILFFGLLPALAVAVLSGDTGTDKASYYTWISNTFNGNMEKVVYEPGFKFLTYALSMIYSSEYFIIPVVSLITSLFLWLAFSGNKWQLIVFTFLLFPYFYFDMTMNGLRYGLSFAISAYAARLILEKKFKSFIIVGLVGVSMQYSSIIIIILLYLSQVNFKKIHLILLVVVGYAVFNILDFGYFDNKVDAYKDLTKPSGLSGVTPLILFTLIFGLNWFLNKKISKILFIIFALQMASFVLSLSSYSGLRFQSLFIFTLLIFIAFFQELKTFKKRYLIFFMVIGFISFSLKIRNFMSEEKEVTTPFLPYEFYWER